MAKPPRARDARRLARRGPVRPPYPRVLIVCEGSKTEPLYLDDIRRQNRVPTAHISIVHGGVTEPRQIVDHAETVFRNGREYEQVFAVFDRDEHRTYISALDRAAELDGSLRNDEGRLVLFRAVPSVPSFELWLLLHFRDVFAFAHRADIFREVQQNIRGYAKGGQGVYGSTKDKLDAATARAVQLRQRFNPRTGIDPYTDVDTLVGLLQSIRRP